MSETRKIAAILVADIVRYSRLAGADEDRTLSRLRGLRSDLIDPAVDAHHGRIVKRTGDGSLIEFRSVVDAVRAPSRCRTVWPSAMLACLLSRIEFRVGIHLGDVVEEADGDLMGDGVNIAARLEGIAEPGMICLSEDAYRQVRERLKHDSSILARRSSRTSRDDRGSMRSTGSESTAPAAAAPNKQGPLRLSVVVLPFANMSGDPDQEYFVDGVTESLTTDLSRIRGSFVIGRNTAFTYKGRHVDLKLIGRELNVRYVLEGSVQRVGTRMRVSAQLIDAESGNHLWAERFDKPLADLFDMQDEIVARLANSLTVQLVVADAQRAERGRIPMRWTSAFKARLGFWGLTLDHLPEARRLFERALALDPATRRAGRHRLRGFGSRARLPCWRSSRAVSRR